MSSSGMSKDKLPWGTKFKKTYPHFIDFQFESGTSTVRYTASPTVYHKDKPVSGKSRIVNSWRSPTQFRAYVCRVNDGPAFSYKTTSNRLHRGDAGFPPDSNFVYFGTSGNGHFPIDSGAGARAQTECLNKIKDAEVNVSESIATFGQTFKLLKDSVLSLIKALNFARRLLRGRAGPELREIYRTYATKSGRKRLRKLLGKEAANRWLEYQYGWKPLMGDIYFALDRLKSTAPKPQWITAKRNITKHEPTPSIPPVNGGFMNINGVVVSGARCRIDCEVTNPGLFELDQVGLTNPALLAWELIPFSFVVDWLLPLGNVIQALTAGLGIAFKAGSLTIWSRANLVCNWTQHPFIGGAMISASLESLSTQRTIFTNLPLPRIYMKNPLSSTTRIATALALLHSMGKVK